MAYSNNVAGGAMELGENLNAKEIPALRNHRFEMDHENAEEIVDRQG